MTAILRQIAKDSPFRCWYVTLLARIGETLDNSRVSGQNLAGFPGQDKREEVTLDVKTLCSDTLVLAFLGCVIGDEASRFFGGCSKAPFADGGEKFVVCELRKVFKNGHCYSP